MIQKKYHIYIFMYVYIYIHISNASFAGSQHCWLYQIFVRTHMYIHKSRSPSSSNHSAEMQPLFVVNYGTINMVSQTTTKVVNKAGNKRRVYTLRTDDCYFLKYIYICFDHLWSNSRVDLNFWIILYVNTCKFHR